MDLIEALQLVTSVLYKILHRVSSALHGKLHRYQYTVQMLIFFRGKGLIFSPSSSMSALTYLHCLHGCTHGIEEDEILAVDKKALSYGMDGTDGQLQVEGETEDTRKVE